MFARLATALTIYAQGTVRASHRKFLHASCRCLGGFERSSLSSLYAITAWDEGIFNPAWPQGRPALRSVQIAPKMRKGRSSAIAQDEVHRGVV